VALRLIYLLPAKVVFIYDWQEGEISKRLGIDATGDRAELQRKISAGDRIIAYDPGDELSEEEQQEDFAWWCKMVREVSGLVPGRKLAIVDESQDLMTTQRIPIELYRLLARGRRREIDTVLIASAANAIHGKGRNQVSELFCFKCVDDNALDYPVSLKMDGEKIQALEKGHFLHKSLETGKIMELALWDGESKEPETPPT
jgi:hypothetical protein